MEYDTPSNIMEINSAFPNSLKNIGSTAGRNPPKVLICEEDELQVELANKETEKIHPPLLPQCLR